MTRPYYESVGDSAMAVVRFDPCKTQTQIANEMGLTIEQLSRATDPNSKPRLPADYIVPITLITGNFAIVRTLCKLVGGVFYQPTRSTTATGSAAKTLQEFSEYLAKLVECEGDGFTRAHVADLEHEMHDVFGEMLAHVDRLKRDAK